MSSYKEECFYLEQELNKLPDDQKALYRKLVVSKMNDSDTYVVLSMFGLGYIHTGEYLKFLILWAVSIYGIYQLFQGEFAIFFFVCFLSSLQVAIAVLFSKSKIERMNNKKIKSFLESYGVGA
jgi:hypothetical protein